VAARPGIEPGTC